MITEMEYSEEGVYDVSEFFNIEECTVVVSEDGKVFFESPEFSIGFVDAEDYLMSFSNVGDGYVFSGNDDGEPVQLKISYEDYGKLEFIFD